MWPFTRAKARTVDSYGGPVPSPGPAKGDLPRFTPLPPTILTHVTLDLVRVWLEEHDLGLFMQSGQLLEHVLRDADLRGAIEQRLGGLLGLPTVIEPADVRPWAKAAALADKLATLWPRMASRAALWDVVTSAIMLGFGVAQIVQDWDAAMGELVPRLDPWPSTHVQYRPWDDTWWAVAREGLVQITPGQGWFLYRPRSVRRAHIWGALRCVAEWFLRSQQAASDAARYAEVRGQGVWIASVPGGDKNSSMAKRWVASIRNLGRGGVIPTPQGKDKESSFDLRIEEAKGNAFEIFDLLFRTSGSRFRLAILGQNLTSHNDKVGTNASSKTGDDIRSDIKEADAETLGDALQEQLLRPWAIYQTGRADLAPWAGWDAEPEADKAEDAQTLATAATGLTVWATLLGAIGRKVDLLAMAQKYGVEVTDEVVAPTQPAPDPTTDHDAPTDDDSEARKVVSLLKPRRYVRRGHLRLAA